MVGTIPGRCPGYSHCAIADWGENCCTNRSPFRDPAHQTTRIAGVFDLRCLRVGAGPLSANALVCAIAAPEIHNTNEIHNALTIAEALGYGSKVRILVANHNRLGVF